MYFLLNLSSVLGLMTLIGLFFNGFIVIMNWIWWLQSKKLQTIDIIVTSLGLSRFFYLVTSIFNFYYYVFVPRKRQTNSLLDTSGIIVMFQAYCCTWFATLLCVFYCVKITSYNYRLFIYMKLNISRILPWLYIVIVTASIISLLPFVLFDTTIHIINSTTAFSNTSVEGKYIRKTFYGHLISNLAGSVLPLPIFCFAISLLIRSLWTHTRHMTSKDSGFRNPQLQAHFSAIRIMLSFFLLHIIYIIAQCVWPYIHRTENEIWISLLSIPTIMYPSLHTVILISSIIKLK
ncbi:taste receptor type 2 member 3-like [Bombina bombina]|uniref:taste receptor type 2 member 3-like n=1 Tax=Bombina bombina TaxID=8345 RepID=UPI00235AB41C|nr:taste receptor type 2 member 3-like [Bombina bombina]